MSSGQASEHHRKLVHRQQSTPGDRLVRPSTRYAAVAGFTANRTRVELPRSPRPSVSSVQLPQPKLTPISHMRAAPVKPRQERSLVLQRSLTSPPPHKSQRKRRHNKVQLGLSGMAVLIFFVGAFVSFNTWRTNHSVKSQVSALAQRSDNQTSSSSDDSVPSETSPSKNSLTSYRVAPDLPRYIRIPKLNVAAAVRRLDVTTSGALAAPNNIYDAGWYDGSSKPGQAGAVLIDGHVHGPTQTGVFYNLKKLQPGDKIQLERGDGTIIQYAVVKSQSYAAGQTDMSGTLTSVVTGKNGLNLITCDGKFDTQSGEYNNRLVVFAVQD